jgi:RNA polymerase sigma-70 factor (ECF subfamily)
MISAKKSLRKSSDEDLIIFLSKGNSRAFEELYRRFSQRLLSYLLHMLGGNSAKAQDILQDVFFSVIEKAESFRPQYKAGSWLFIIAGNLCKNEYRRLGRIASMHNTHLDQQSFSSDFDEQNVLDPIDKKKFKNLLYKKLYQVNPENRSIFLMRFLEELSVKEIAEIMDCPEGTVKSRLHYTVKKLAHSLKAYNPMQNIEVSP